MKDPENSLARFVQEKAKMNHQQAFHGHAWVAGFRKYQKRSSPSSV